MEKSARMKACTCMNPMDTALGLFGCLLGYTRICDEMQDPDLVNLITRMSEREAMPLVTDPGVIDPFEMCIRDRKKHRPQNVSTLTVTRSPGLTAVTAAPTCSTTPTLSLIHI